MAITYPLAPPSALAVSRLRWSAQAVVALSESPFTLQGQAQEFAGQRWAGTLALPRLARSAAEEVIAFLLKLNGIRGSFLFGDPSGATPRGTGNGLTESDGSSLDLNFAADTYFRANAITPKVNGANQAGNELDTHGWALNETVLLPGDYIQLGTGSAARLYRNLDTATTNSAGEVTLTLWPNLRTSPADGADIIVRSTQGVFRLARNDIELDIDSAMRYGIEIPIVEKL